MTIYCHHCNFHPWDVRNKSYYDNEYGFPLQGDNLLFERLILELNQAELSWITILKKAENFRNAYSGCDVDKVEAFGEADKARLLADTGIIRNRLKVNAAIENARRIQSLRREYGSFKGRLDDHPQALEGWIKLFRGAFVFAGGEIVNKFLMSTGCLSGAHTPDGPIYETILAM